MEAGAGQVRQEDTPARCETISPLAVKAQAGKCDCYDNDEMSRLSDHMDG